MLQEFDEKDADEFEDINAKNVMAELNKPIAFNKEDELVNKYNLTLDTKQVVEEKRIIEQQ